MKIYFAGSIRGGRKDVAIYSKIIAYLERWGEILTEHIGSDSLKSDGESNLSDNEIHNRDLDWIKGCDLVIAEVTNPSLGVGYELGRAISFNKNIICLFRQDKKNKLSAMIGGSSDLDIITYTTLDDLKEKLDILLKC